MHDGTPDAWVAIMLDSINAKSLIKPNMPVVCSDDGLLAVVDHLEGSEVIKLAKDSNGQHHYIPLTWVDSVDDKVHIDRTGDQAMKEWSRTPPIPKASARGRAAPHHVNSVDATAGQPIVTRVLARKRELEAARARLPADDVRTRLDLDLALSTVSEMLTGNLNNVPAAVAAEMNRWLEHNKHLAESAVEPVTEPMSGPVTEPVIEAVSDLGSGPVTEPWTKNAPPSGPTPKH
jgi:hypothetical protein